MTKDEQKELLAVAHHLRQALVHLTQAHVAAKRAERAAGGEDSRMSSEVGVLVIHVTNLETKVARLAGPVERHPRFPCNRPDCPIHVSISPPPEPDRDTDPGEPY